MQPHEHDNRIILRPRGNTVAQFLSDVANLAAGCIARLVWIGFSVRLTVQLGRSKFRIPQALFVAIAALLAYLFLACAISFAKKASVTNAPGPALDCGDACCRIATACDLHIRLEPMTRRSHMWPADHTSSPTLYSVLQVSPLTPRADLRGAAREAARRVRDGGFSDAEVASLVPAIYRTAQFLAHDPSRQVYDEFFTRVLPDDHVLRGPATNRHHPLDKSAPPRWLAGICSAAKNQCCENPVGGM